MLERLHHCGFCLFVFLTVKMCASFIAENCSCTILALLLLAPVLLGLGETTHSEILRTKSVKPATVLTVFRIAFICVLCFVEKLSDPERPNCQNLSSAY